MPIRPPRKAVQRWRQPGQQQGRRFPSISSVRVLSIRRALVSGFLAESIQHIHSLRARGVISSHAASAFESEVRGFGKSGGTLCTTPEAISFLVIASPIPRNKEPSSAPGPLSFNPSRPIRAARTARPRERTLARTSVLLCRDISFIVRCAVACRSRNPAQSH
jgi:hypothetical protein